VQHTIVAEYRVALLLVETILKFNTMRKITTLPSGKRLITYYSKDIDTNKIVKHYHIAKLIINN